MFTIQLGHPKINAIAAKEFETVKQLLYQLFYSDEESFYIIWNHIPIAFDYKESLFNNFDDILAMIWLVNKEDKGETKINLTSNNLSIKFHLSWKDDQIIIDANFDTPVQHLKKYAAILEKQVSFPKNEYLNEWNTLLRQIISSIEASKCTIADTTERRKLELLQQTETAIKSYGKLYVNT